MSRETRWEEQLLLGKCTQLSRCEVSESLPFLKANILACPSSTEAKRRHDSLGLEIWNFNSHNNSSSHSVNTYITSYTPNFQRWSKEVQGTPCQTHSGMCYRRGASGLRRQYFNIRINLSDLFQLWNCLKSEVIINAFLVKCEWLPWWYWSKGDIKMFHN